VTWPIGHAKLGNFYETSANGTVFVNGHRLTREGGWLDLNLPEAQPSSPVGTISLQIRVSPDEKGQPFIYAESVSANGARWNNVMAFLVSDGEPWAKRLSEILQAEIDRRIVALSRPLSSRHKVPTEAEIAEVLVESSESESRSRRKRR
jgi:hypothetical protein